jgi:RNA polymerase sigma-70 factor (ECF subfamily)
MKPKQGGKDLFDNENVEAEIDIVYQRYYLEVYRFLICFSGNQKDAEDLTQEVFIQVLNNFSNIDSIVNFKTLIFSIAKYVAIDHYRKRRFSSLFTDG